MTDSEKFQTAINTLKSGVEYTYIDDVPTTEELFNNIRWTTGVDENGLAIETTTCPHSEITFAKLLEEMNKL